MEIIETFKFTSMSDVISHTDEFVAMCEAGAGATTRREALSDAQFSLDHFDRHKSITLRYWLLGQFVGRRRLVRDVSTAAAAVLPTDQAAEREARNGLWLLTYGSVRELEAVREPLPRIVDSLTPQERITLARCRNQRYGSDAAYKSHKTRTAA